jgi:hypothetical protein
MTTLQLGFEQPFFILQNKILTELEICSWCDEEEEDRMRKEMRRNKSDGCE